MAKPKILILNGSHSEIPLIRAAKNFNYHVITTGNAPDLIGHQYADEYHNADFSDKDSILELASNLKIDAICASANDFGAITASYVAERISLPGHDDYETTLTIHHKDRFKAYAERLNIPTPKATSYTKIDDALVDKEKLNFPVMVKPIDLTGGKGITKVSDPAELNNALQKAFQKSPSKKIVVEEFFEGTQHSFSTFLVNKKVALSYSDNEYSYLNPYLVTTSAGPATNIELFRKYLIQIAEKIASSLSLVDGVLHFQYLANENKFTIIEITRRCSGDLYPYPVNHALGVDWGELIIRGESGLTLSHVKPVQQTGFYGRHCIMSAANGTQKKLFYSDAIKSNIIQKITLKKDGNIVTDYQSDKLAVVILQYQSEQEMIEKTSHLNELIYVQLD